MNKPFFIKLEKLSLASSLKIGGFITLASFLILFLLQPFGEVIHGLYLIGILRTISYAVAAGSLFTLSEFLILPQFLKLPFSKNRFSVVLWYLCVLFIVTTGLFICKNYWMDFSVFTLSDYGIMIYRVTVIGIIPTIILLIYIQYASIKEYQNKEIIFSSNEHNPEYFKINSHKVIAIVSEENYVSVLYTKGEAVKKKLLRSSLSNISEKVGSPFIRVHRSHVVNMQNILSVSGNSQGLTLTMNSSDLKLKVSRSYISDFNKNWSEFSESV